MSKFFKFLDKYEKFKKPIQIVIYIFIAMVFASTIIGVIFGVKSCSAKEVTEAKYFISDTVKVHDNFNIKVLSARTVSSISILKKESELSKSTKNGNFIAVEVEISKDVNSEKVHKLDVNDFKLKDHTGLYLPLNTIMSFFNIDAIDMHVDTDDNGFIRSDVDFSTRNAAKDYTWVNKQITKEVMNFTIYFKMDENYKVEENVMVLEIDFYVGKNGIKKGEDIVLVKCVKDNDPT